MNTVWTKIGRSATVAPLGLSFSASGGSNSYALPLPEWNRAVALAQWMSDLDTKSPLRRRMASYLKESGRGSSFAAGR